MEGRNLKSNIKLTDCFRYVAHGALLRLCPMGSINNKQILTTF